MSTLVAPRLMQFFATYRGIIGDAEGNLLWRLQEKTRHHHGIAHIEDLFDKIEIFSPTIDANANVLMALRLAAVWHDSVLDVARDDNVYQSCRLMMLQIGPVLGHLTCFWQAQHIIMATMHHDPSSDPVVQFFLDLDMSVLASKPAEYLRYQCNIRMEYAQLSDEEFRKGRQIFLKNILARPFIFGTPHLHGLWENAARANIENELAE